MHFTHIFCSISYRFPAKLKCYTTLSNVAAEALERLIGRAIPSSSKHLKSIQLTFSSVLSSSEEQAWCRQQALNCSWFSPVGKRIPIVVGVKNTHLFSLTCNSGVQGQVLVGDTRAGGAGRRRGGDGRKLMAEKKSTLCQCL